MNPTTAEEAVSICRCGMDTNTLNSKRADKHTHIWCVTLGTDTRLSRWREPPTHCQLLYNMYCITAKSSEPRSEKLNTDGHAGCQDAVSIHINGKSTVKVFLLHRALDTWVNPPAIQSGSIQPASWLNHKTAGQPLRRIIHVSVCQLYSCAQSHSCPEKHTY